MGILLNRRERKVLILGSLALVVAIVTYGGLASTGNFQNDWYNLGGAIVGFLAALAALNKVYGQPEEGLSAEEIKDADFLSVETLKILDLRNRVEVEEKDRHTDPRSLVVEVDQHRMRKLTDSGTLHFHFATTGYGIEGENLSFPRDFQWIETTKSEATLGRDQHLKRRYDLTINVTEVHKGADLDIKNRLTFKNAFQGATKEWFHTHVDFPTEALAMVLLFPECKPCKSVKGLVQFSSRTPFKELREARPTRVRNGDLVYWSIRNPKKGAAYQIEWTW